MLKKCLLMISVIAILTASAPLSKDNVSAETTSAERYILSATGKMTATADIVKIYAGTDTYSLTLDEGLKNSSETFKKISDAFSQYGTVQEDYFSAYPAYDKNGYYVTRQICCTSAQIEDSDKMLSALTGAGANKICSVTFTCSRENELETGALKNALENIKEKAAAIDGNLKLLELTEFCAYPVCMDIIANANCKSICVEAHVQAVFGY